MAQIYRGLLDRVKENQAPDPEENLDSPEPFEEARGPQPRLTVLPERPEPEERAGAHGVEPPLASHLLTLKKTIHNRLLGRHAIDVDPARRQEIHDKIVELLDEQQRDTGGTLPRAERTRLVEALLDDICGLGPLQGLMDDSSVTEIMINHPSQVYVERKGRISLSEARFDDTSHLLRVIDRVVSSVGRHVDEANPYVDARLSDGSRVNVIIPPLTLKGPSMTIRKFAKERLGPEDILGLRSATQDMLSFLQSAVRSGCNLLVSGGTGSGKTTLLNILSSYIPNEERVITCEDAAELQLQQPHVITLESRPPNVEGNGEVTIRDLVRNCLRMRPDRIIVGECRGGEALDMLQAMNTGHDGSMSTLHANSPIEAMGRLETLVLMAGAELPSRAIREQVASALHLVVQQRRLRGGGRRIVAVSEVTQFDERTGSVQLQDLFVFKQLGVSPEGRAIGYHTATGRLPHHTDRLRESGEEPPSSLFEPTPRPPDEELY